MVPPLYQHTFQRIPSLRRWRWRRGQIWGIPWRERTNCACRSRFLPSSDSLVIFGSMLSHAIFENLQVSDLVELTKQQAVTIRRLERDSLAKSDRIADIETRCRCKLQMSLNPFSILQSWCFPLLLLPPPLLSPLCPNASAFPEDARPSKVIKI